MWESPRPAHAQHHLVRKTAKAGCDVRDLRTLRLHRGDGQGGGGSRAVRLMRRCHRDEGRAKLARPARDARWRRGEGFTNHHHPAGQYQKATSDRLSQRCRYSGSRNLCRSGCPGDDRGRLLVSVRSAAPPFGRHLVLAVDCRLDQCVEAQRDARAPGGLRRRFSVH